VTMNCGEWVDAWLANGGHAMPIHGTLSHASSKFLSVSAKNQDKLG
jgi:hypothetical protein